MKIGVHNGEPYSKDAETKRRITSPMALDGPVSDYKSKANVKRVMELMDEAAWEALFPYRNELYTYDGFLEAVGKFPAFCGESNLAVYHKDLDMTCKRELATLFAHFA